MSDYLQPQDLIDDKKHSTFFAEVITGKAGGVAGGATIDTATNAVTSQVQKTMPKIMVDAESAFDAQLSSQQSEFDAQHHEQQLEHDNQIAAHEIEHDNQIAAHEAEFIAQLQAQGWNPVAGSFETGGTIVNRRDILWWEAAKSWYSWQGVIPLGGYVVTAGSTPATAGGVSPTEWVDRTDGALREQLASDDGSAIIGGFSYSSLRLFTGETKGRVTVFGRANVFDGAQGAFFLVSGDTTTEDNDCTVLVDGLGRRWRRDFSKKRVNVAWSGSTGVGTDDYTAIAKAIAAAGIGGSIYIPAGYNCRTSQTINLNDTHCSVFGDGPAVSKITALAGLTTAVISQLNASTDGGDTFEVIDGIGIYGNYSATLIGINQRYTARSTIRNVLVQGCGVGIRQIDNFVHLMEQVEIKDCKTCLYLVGSNHNSEYVRVGCVGFGDSFGGVGEALKIEYSGDDNLQSSIAFRGCDFEFGAGDGAVIGVTGTVIFDNCYMEKVGGRMFVINDGDVIVSGGEYIIKDATGYLVDPIGGNGRIYFKDKAGITSDGVTRIYSALIKTGGSGRVYFENSSLFQRMLTTNNGVIPSNLGRLGREAPFLQPQGRKFGANAFSGALTQTVAGDSKTVTCTTAGNLGVYQQMTRQPFVNENAALVIKYASNVTLSVTTVSAAGQSSPIYTIGSLPNSAGTTQIAVFPNSRITDITQQWLEFWKASGWAVGEYLTLHEVWWCSGDSIRNGELSLG